MDQIDARQLDRLTLRNPIADYELDLRGATPVLAERSIARMLERSRFRRPRLILVSIDPPSPGGGETLFQPVGRQLLAARRAGLLSLCRALDPSANTGVGFCIETVGNPNIAEADEPAESELASPVPDDSGPDDGGPTSA